MLPKARRLTALEVRDVLKRGRSRRGEYLSVKLLAQTSPLRISVVVPKSIAKRAVDRNRLRRAAYHALEKLEGTGTAVIFVQKCPKLPLQAVFREELIKLLPR